MPFSNPIPGGLSNGKQIQIQGVFNDVAGGSNGYVFVSFCFIRSMALVGQML